MIVTVTRYDYATKRTSSYELDSESALREIVRRLSATDADHAFMTWSDGRQEVVVFGEQEARYQYEWN